MCFMHITIIIAHGSTNNSGSQVEAPLVSPSAPLNTRTAPMTASAQTLNHPHPPSVLRPQLAAGGSETDEVRVISWFGFMTFSRLGLRVLSIVGGSKAFCDFCSHEDQSRRSTPMKTALRWIRTYKGFWGVAVLDPHVSQVSIALTHASSD